MVGKGHKNFRKHYDHYRKKGGAEFVWKNVLRLILTLGAFILLFASVQYFFPDQLARADAYIALYHPSIVFALFFLSESLLGLLPPDLFILWVQKLNFPWLNLSILAILSYLGGVVSFFIGYRLSYLSILESYLEKKLRENIDLIKKWGGLLIVIAALFPLPFSPICLAAGMIRFPIKNFLIFSLFRILRFYFYALILFRLF